MARTCLPCRGRMLRYPAGVVVVMLSSTTSVLWLYHEAGAPLKHSKVMTTSWLLRRGKEPLTMRLSLRRHWLLTNVWVWGCRA